MRLTTEQRIASLERDNVVLHDTVKLLHKLLREQRQLINDYITQRIASVGGNEGRDENKRTEDALYTFVCRRRFEDLEKHMGRIRKLVENPNTELEAV